MTLLSINAAAAAGIDRFRDPKWVNKLEHLSIHITEDRKPGLWIRLHSPNNVAINGRDPVERLLVIDATPEQMDLLLYEAYDGPLPGSPEYQAAERAAIEAWNLFLPPKETS